jgi:hypothetical protein
MDDRACWPLMRRALPSLMPSHLAVLPSLMPSPRYLNTLEKGFTVLKTASVTGNVKAYPFTVKTCLHVTNC